MKAKMKNFYVLFLCIFLFSACKKETSPGSLTQIIQLEINAVHWSAEVASWASSGGSQQINSLTKSDGSFMQIFLPLDTIGTFLASDNIVTVAYNDGTDMYSNNVSGTVVLTRNSANEIEGTFNLEVASYFTSDTLDFKDGSFYWSSI